MAIDFPSSPTNGQTYTSGGTTWVYDSSVPAWNLQNTVISGPTGPTGPTGPAGTAFVGYDNEIHVSGVDGSDSTGNGDLLNPVATIAYAITLVTSNRNTIVVHPGTYAESPTLTAKTFLKSANGPANNDGPYINGTVTVPTAANQTQITGLSIATLTITGTAGATIDSCNVAAVNKSSSGTVIFFAGQVGNSAVSGSVALTGTGVTRFLACSAVYSVTQNNASSSCVFATCQVVFNTVNTTGNMFFANSSAFTSGTYAVQSAGGSLNISNSSMFNAIGTALTPITVTGGTYSLANVQMNYATSVFTGATNANPNANFAQITADKLVTRNGTSSQYVKGDGTLDSVTAPVIKTVDFVVGVDEDYIINDKPSATCLGTLPAPASFTGRKIVITNRQAQLVESGSSNVIPIIGGSAGTAILPATAGAWATLVSDGTNWLIVQEG
jgi:hypothetical protein